MQDVQLCFFSLIISLSGTLIQIDNSSCEKKAKTYLRKEMNTHFEIQQLTHVEECDRTKAVVFFLMIKNNNDENEYHHLEKGQFY
jgi:hypothetical protein